MLTHFQLLCQDFELGISFSDKIHHISNGCICRRAYVATLCCWVLIQKDKSPDHIVYVDIRYALEEWKLEMLP